MWPPVPFPPSAQTPSGFPLPFKFLETVPMTPTGSKERDVQVLKGKHSYLHKQSQPHTDLPMFKVTLKLSGTLYSLLLHGPLSPLKKK